MAEQTTSERARDIARDALDAGDRLTRVTAANAIALHDLADATIAASRPAGNDRACVQTILRAVRSPWVDAQQELDAVYEALRHFGHSV